MEIEEYKEIFIFIIKDSFLLPRRYLFIFAALGRNTKFSFLFFFIHFPKNGLKSIRRAHSYLKNEVPIPQSIACIHAVSGYLYVVRVVAWLVRTGTSSFKPVFPRKAKKNMKEKEKKRKKKKKKKDDSQPPDIVIEATEASYDRTHARTTCWGKTRARYTTYLVKSQLWFWMCKKEKSSFVYAQHLLGICLTFSTVTWIELVRLLERGKTMASHAHPLSPHGISIEVAVSNQKVLLA